MDMLDERSTALLRKLFSATTRSARGQNAMKFRAEHHEQLDTLDGLQAEGYLDIREEKYFLKLPCLQVLAGSTQEIKSLLFLCEHLFGVLRRWYIQNPGKSLEIDKLAELADMPKRGIQIALRYMHEGPIFAGWSSDPEGIAISITPCERIIRHENFASVIDEVKQWRKASHETAWMGSSVDHEPALENPAAPNYVDPRRIKNLQSIISNDFDLRKVIRLCEELNDCSKRGNFIAVASLVRALLDHIPPIFDRASFKEVANNFAGKSLKRSFQNLENSSRKISDALLHQTIRKRESLPTRVMVNFSNDFDVLLGEVARILDERNGKS